MFATIFALVMLAVAVVVAYDFVRAYRDAAGAGWRRVWNAGRGSATIALQQLAAVVTALALAADKVIDWACALLNDPAAADAIKGVLANYFTPTNLGIATLILIGLTVLARFRSLRGA